MTQEELDALMGGDIDIDALEEASDESLVEEENTTDETVADDDTAYRAAATNLTPPPASDENKMVHQLDDVTKESEEKATEIFDIIENISDNLMNREDAAQNIIDVFNENITLFSHLSEKFPDIETFKTSLERNKIAQEQSQEALDLLQTTGDQIMQVMDIMQYQDIHRQKIERVINVMRALSAYMNTLFSGKIDDDKRVASAVHLPGDETEDTVDNDDIEALLASFGK